MDKKLKENNEELVKVLELVSILKKEKEELQRSMEYAPELMLEQMKVRDLIQENKALKKQIE